MDNSECQEALLWQQVADAQTRDIALNNLFGEEQGVRNSIISEQGIGAASLWNVAALQANTMMFLLHQRCDEAAQEALSWQQVSDSLAQECESQRHRTSVHEKVLQDEMSLKKQMMEQELQAKMNVEGVHVALQDDVRDLQNRKLVLERNITEMNQEMSAMQTNLQAHKISSLDEKQQLEQQLQALRAQISTERASLQEVREANQQQQQQQQRQPQLSPRGASSSPERGAAAPHSAAPLSTSRSAGGSQQFLLSPNSSDAHQQEASYGGTPTRSGSTLASGLAALQNVREQLREMRESSVNNNSASPQRAQSATNIGGYSADRGAAGGSVPRGGAEMGGGEQNEMRHANSYAFMPTSPDSNTAYGGHPSTGGQSAASPWKARLLKLQGELKSLRTELGTSSPE